MCPACLTEALDLLRAQAEQLMADADKAGASAALKVHEGVLRRQAVGLGLAVAYLRGGDAA